MGKGIASYIERSLCFWGTSSTKALLGDRLWTLVHGGARIGANHILFNLIWSILAIHNMRNRMTALLCDPARLLGYIFCTDFTSGITAAISGCKPLTSHRASKA